MEPPKKRGMEYIELTDCGRHRRRIEREEGGKERVTVVSGGGEREEEGLVSVISLTKSGGGKCVFTIRGGNPCNGQPMYTEIAEGGWGLSPAAISWRPDLFSPRGEKKEATSRMNERNRNRNIGDRYEAGLFLKKAEVEFVALVVDLLLEVLELALPGIMLLLRLPGVASLVVEPSPPPRTPRDFLSFCFPS
ncbi:hypothetical protein BHE74_00034385 [Ensete ventricosum]|nr:hypothetical protein BHE74_00034385 [Ensete ventricosum]